MNESQVMAHNESGDGRHSGAKVSGTGRRAKRSFALLLAVIPAFLVAAMAVWLQIQVNSTADVPSGDVEDGIAMALRGIDSRPGHGLRVDMALTVNSAGLHLLACAKTAHATVVFSGTPSFWRDQAKRLLKLTPLAVMIFTPARIAHATLAMADAQDPGAPLDPRTAETDSTATDLFDLKTQHFYYGTRLTGRIRNWGRTWRPLILTFDVDWVSGRGFGSCFVRMPSLTGTSPGQRRGAIANALFGLYGVRDVPPVILKQNNGDPQIALYSYVEDVLSNRVIPASYGSVDVNTPGEMDISAADSSPTPSVSGTKEALWSCAPSKADKEIQPGEGVRSPIGTWRAFSAAKPGPGDLGCEGLAVATIRRRHTFMTAPSSCSGSFWLGPLIRFGRD